MELSPKISILPKSLEEYIDDFDITYKTPKNQFLGTFIGRSLTLQLSRIEEEIPGEIKIEIEINGINEKQPSFIISKPIEDEISEEVELKGFDYSIKFDVPFDPSIVSFPCTNAQLGQAVCEYCGTELENTDFINSNFIITKQKVDSKNSCREIIGMIACDAAGIAFMNGNDKVEISSIIDSGIEIEDIFEHKFTQKIGPINSVVVAREPISDYVVLKNNESIKNNGLTEIKIINNVLIDDNRELAIVPIFNKLNGIKFNCATIETYEGFRIKPFSLITIDNQKVLITNINIKYPNILDGSIGSEQLTKTESNYKIAKGLEKRIINAEAEVNKVTGEIKLISEQITENSEKIAKQEIDIDTITMTVSETETRLNNDYLTAEQIEAENSSIKEGLDIIKQQQASMELTSTGLQVQIDSINNEGVKTVKNTLVEIDEEGIKVSKGTEFNSLLDDTGVYLNAYDKEIASYTKDGARMYNLTVQNEAIIGNLRCMSVEVEGEKRTHIHWIGG